MLSSMLYVSCWQTSLNGSSPSTPMRTASWTMTIWNLNLFILSSVVSVARLYQDSVLAPLLPAPLTTFVTEDHSHLLIGVALILVRGFFLNDFVLHSVDLRHQRLRHVDGAAHCYLILFAHDYRVFFLCRRKRCGMYMRTGAHLTDLQHRPNWKKLTPQHSHTPDHTAQQKPPVSSAHLGHSSLVLEITLCLLWPATACCRLFPNSSSEFCACTPITCSICSRLYLFLFFSAYYHCFLSNDTLVSLQSLSYILGFQLRAASHKP